MRADSPDQLFLKRNAPGKMTGSAVRGTLSANIELLKIPQHARKYFLPYADAFLPVWSLWATGVVIPFIELIAGGLVILGLRTREALVSLGFVLAIVTFGHLLKEPLYEFHTHVIPRLALLLFILLLPREDDRFSIDHLLTRNSVAGSNAKD